MLGRSSALVALSPTLIPLDIIQLLVLFNPRVHLRSFQMPGFYRFQY